MSLSSHSPLFPINTSKTQHPLLNSSSSPSSEQTEIPQTSFLSELKAKTSYKETPVFKKINQQNGGEIDLSGLELEKIPL